VRRPEESRKRHKSGSAEGEGGRGEGNEVLEEALFVRYSPPHREGHSHTRFGREEILYFIYTSSPGDGSNLTRRARERGFA